MTIVVEDTGDGPALHAFLIGVGAYRHLPGGSGPATVKQPRLKQLPTPPLSVTAMLDWLRTGYRNAAVPLGSVEVLVSAPGGGAVDGVPVDEATMANVRTAKNAWLARCDRHAGNVALFYFCGHGLQGTNQYLLLDDFGADPTDTMATTIDLDRFHAGMAGCKASTQLFIADACRQVPWEMSILHDVLGASLLPAKVGGNNGRNAPILRATAIGEAAFGPDDGVTYFTDALLRGLRGAGATESAENRWEVKYFGLVSAIDTLLEEVSGPAGEQQANRSGGDAGNVLLTELPGLPEVPVLVECEPPESADYTTLELASAAGVHSREPGPGAWRIEVPVDFQCRLGARYRDDRHLPWQRTVAVYPPTRRFRARTDGT